MIWTYFCYDNITEHFITKNQEFTCPFAIWMDLWSTGKHFYQYSRSYYDIPRPFDSHFDWKKELMSGALKWAWTGASAHSARGQNRGSLLRGWRHPPQVYCQDHFDQEVFQTLLFRLRRFLFDLNVDDVVCESS